MRAHCLFTRISATRLPASHPPTLPTIQGVPPPSSGGATVMQTINFLSGFPLPMAGSGSLGSHRMVEAFKHAFAMRMSLGDPMDPFVKNNTDVVRSKKRRIERDVSA